jgi:hypothetical protein
MSELESIREELAAVTVALADLETTLSTLAQGLARHPPGDMEPVRAEIEQLRKAFVGMPVRGAGVGRWWVRGIAIGVGLWLGALVWGTIRAEEPKEARVQQLFQQVDQVLVTQYGELGKPVQQRLRAVYKQAGVASPDERQKR